MIASRHIKLVHEGEYVAQVEVQLDGADEPWGPYLSLDDACKLDEVREALIEATSPRLQRRHASSG